MQSGEFRIIRLFASNRSSSSVPLASYLVYPHNFPCAFRSPNNIWFLLWFLEDSQSVVSSSRSALGGQYILPMLRSSSPGSIVRFTNMECWCFADWQCFMFWFMMIMWLFFDVLE